MYDCRVVALPVTWGMFCAELMGNLTLATRIFSALGHLMTFSHSSSIMFKVMHMRVPATSVCAYLTRRQEFLPSCGGGGARVRRSPCVISSAAPLVLKGGERGVIFGKGEGRGGTVQR
jgi:hypothetical protein